MYVFGAKKSNPKPIDNPRYISNCLHFITDCTFYSINKIKKTKSSTVDFLNSMTYTAICFIPYNIHVQQEHALRLLVVLQVIPV
jgi:hypothetical protein